MNATSERKGGKQEKENDISFLDGNGKGGSGEKSDQVKRGAFARIEPPKVENQHGGEEEGDIVAAEA